MELISKSLNAPVPYTTMYHSGQKMHISVLNDALWDIGLVHCAIWEYSLFQWNVFTNPTMHLSIFHNVPFKTKNYTFLFWIVHCEISDWCIVGFVNKVFFMEFEQTVALKNVRMSPAIFWPFCFGANEVLRAIQIKWRTSVHTEACNHLILSKVINWWSVFSDLTRVAAKQVGSDNKLQTKPVSQTSGQFQHMFVTYFAAHVLKCTDSYVQAHNTFSVIMVILWNGCTFLHIAFTRLFVNLNWVNLLCRSVWPHCPYMVQCDSVYD